jgi:hypothetical protein
VELEGQECVTQQGFHPSGVATVGDNLTPVVDRDQVGVQLPLDAKRAPD